MPRYRKNYRRRYRHTRKPRGSGIALAFPKNKVVKMKYVDTFTLDPVDFASISQVAYRMNDINDPQDAVGGHQPSGHDEWGQFYGSYVVSGCSVKLTVASNSAGTAQHPVYIVASLSPSNSIVASDLRSMIEQGSTNTKWRLIVPSNAAGVTTLRHYFSAKNFFNISDIKDNSDDLGALYFGEPDRKAFLNIAVQSADGTANPQGITVTMELIYTVILGDPLILPPS